MAYEKGIDFRKLVRRKLEFFGLHNQKYLDVICYGMFGEYFKENIGSYIIPANEITINEAEGDCSYKYEFQTVSSTADDKNVIELFTKENGSVALRAEIGDTHFYSVANGSTLSFGELKDDQMVESVVNITNNEVTSVKVCRTNLEGDVQNATVKPMAIKIKANEYYSYTPKKHGDKPESIGRFIDKFDRSSRFMAVQTSRDLKESTSYIPNIINSTIQEMDKDVALKEVKKRRLHK